MGNKKRFYILLEAQFRASAFEHEFERSMQCLVKEIKSKYYERKESGVDVNYSSTTGKENGKYHTNLLFYKAFQKKLNGAD